MFKRKQKISQIVASHLMTLRCGANANVRAERARKGAETRRRTALARAKEREVLATLGGPVPQDGNPGESPEILRALAEPDPTVRARLDEANAWSPMIA